MPKDLEGTKIDVADIRYHSIQSIETVQFFLMEHKKPTVRPVRFGTKAETLQVLYERLMCACVLPQICFSVREWREDETTILSNVLTSGWLQEKVIVRSSALSEDHADESLAGKYSSIGSVQNEEELIRAISLVIDSYGDSDAEDQILIQPMLSAVTMSGVAFSRDPNTGAPYYVINYDDVTGSTSSVTAGHSNHLKTAYLYKYYNGKTGFSHEILKIAELMRELEKLFGTDRIDIEFAWSGGQLYLLQVRPLVLHAQPCEEELESALQRISNKVNMWNHTHPYLHGTKTVFGVMPDWNPAEIIGIRPRPLARSLYKKVVTDRIWAQQRFDYGYKNVHNFPLMIDFCGLPYIDVRVSFNSFLPAGLNEPLSEKLVNYYLDRLIESPNTHDKVEFEIVISCYTFDLSKKLENLKKHGFEQWELSEFQDRLRPLTNRIIGRNGLWKEDIRKIELLKDRYQNVIESNLDSIAKIYWLLEDCQSYGTLPFAGLARAGFIAVQLIQSLVQVGALSKHDYDSFMNSLCTVSSKMFSDFQMLDKEEFLKEYGHLRPGTYDILSPRYDEDSDYYFNWERKVNKKREDTATFQLAPSQKATINQLLQQHGIKHDSDSLFDFIKGAIEGREYAKFVFSKSLSEAISLFKEFACGHGFTMEEASYANISCIYDLYGSCNNAEEKLYRSIQEGREKHRLTKQLLLPPLITNEIDVWAFEVPPFEPNFVTQKTAKGTVSFVSDKEKLENTILFIESADPGYDWIFTKGIAGFITLYGGANSHMAIRAGELGIPAVIGAGESLYRRWSAAEVIELDCMNRHVRILR
ncbi:hypothetical protein LSG31_13615 [Fodinisporobacter ferrooxydans]|uniref:Phosphoenolpyruvate synthase n=1 Tax=Fodinisporobacter ferrooxydans TaxID=2901836 RepID=A0ABY4CEL5_9BACL|nr:hypothetical protein LSG31_13615 [Alicyclobacillaceae bacterium MYW30-H2]